VDDESLEGAVGRMLRARGLQLAVMESCTGGLLASTITDSPGASESFRGGLVSYTTDVKTQFGVSHEIVDEFGVISPECAIAMATAARNVLGADIGVGITGVAGPDTQEGKPVGTVHVGYDDGQGEPSATSSMFPQSREAIKRRAVTTALLVIRRSLLAADR
jgi:nicotinamide-nucleotide amidase